jgi:sterol desaturase/sphingolipid hydroxylase (fatty acid hydroxylase superfamily)
MKNFNRILGPMGHYLVTLILPVHPIALAFFGLFTSCYASKIIKIYLSVGEQLFFLYLVAAHDGRLGDLNHHYAHHNKGNSLYLFIIRRLFIILGKGRLHNFNYGLYWPLWDLICGTRYRDNSNRNDVNHSTEIKRTQ